MWQRGIQMRRNIVAGNFQGWRLFSNTDCPVAELLPTRDMNKVKQDLGEFPKLSTNDDLKIDWDDKHLVLFHFFRGEGESCTIRLWDIQVGLRSHILHTEDFLNCRMSRFLSTKWRKVSSASLTRSQSTATMW